MSMNVSVGNPLEDYVRGKVAQGEYNSTSEVVREGLRLLKRREELWQATIRHKIDEGMVSLRAGRTIPAEEVWAKVEARIAKAEHGGHE
jgi:antitoxin ParD1/3/4